MNKLYDQTAWLKGGDARCAAIPPASERAYRLVLLGAPGVGKGTQAELLRHRLGACHLSTGEFFRVATCLPSREQTPALQAARQSMSQGKLVSDDTVLALLRERTRCLHCHTGFLLDGFPRTIAQAEALENLLQKEHIRLTAVINYEMDLDKIMARLAGRRTCPKCQAVFHVTGRPPKKRGVCDQCGALLVQRDDDQPGAIRVRMKAYHEITTPLIDFYRERGLLISIAADSSAEKTCLHTLAALDARVRW